MRYLWVQDQVKRELLGLENVVGADSPADIATKHFSAEVMNQHLKRLSVRTGGGTARGAPVLGSLAKGSSRRGRRGGAAIRALRGGTTAGHEQTSGQAATLQSGQRRACHKQVGLDLLNFPKK